MLVILYNFFNFNFIILILPKFSYRAVLTFFLGEKLFEINYYPRAFLLILSLFWNHHITALYLSYFDYYKVPKIVSSSENNCGISCKLAYSFLFGREIL